MKFHQEFLTILEIIENQNNLILRLDASDVFDFEDYKQKVVEVTLVNCENFHASLEEIKQYIGELIWNYEFLEEENLFKILMDNGDEIKFHCNKIIEKNDDITVDELSLKFKWLAENYQQESESSSKGWGKYQKLREVLISEMTNDSKNWEKRKAFFEQSNFEQVEKAEAVIKFCHKILNLIEQVEMEKR